VDAGEPEEHVLVESENGGERPEDADVAGDRLALLPRPDRARRPSHELGHPRGGQSELLAAAADENPEILHGGEVTDTLSPTVPR